MTKITKTHFNYLLIIFLFLTAFNVFSAQKFSVTDGDVIQVKISSKYLTRITVEKGRIEKIWGPAGVLETQVDKKEGEVFLRPAHSAGNALSFFVKDGFGSTYTVIGEQFDIPSQTVILSPLKRNFRTSLRGSSKDQSRSNPLIKEVKNMIRSLCQRESDGGYSVVKVNQVISLWKEVRVTHLRDLLGEKMMGEVFELQNISTEEIRMAEEEFLNFRSEILAVAIEKMTLQKGEKTQLYIVRKR